MECLLPSTGYYSHFRISRHAELLPSAMSISTWEFSPWTPKSSFVHSVIKLEIGPKWITKWFFLLYNPVHITSNGSTSTLCSSTNLETCRNPRATCLIWMLSHWSVVPGTVTDRQFRLQYFRPTQWPYQKPHRANTFWLPVFWTVFWGNCSIFHTDFSPSRLLFCSISPPSHEIIPNMVHGLCAGQEIHSLHLLRVISVSDQMRQSPYDWDIHRKDEQKSRSRVFAFTWSFPKISQTWLSLFCILLRWIWCGNKG